MATTSAGNDLNEDILPIEASLTCANGNCRREKFNFSGLNCYVYFSGLKFEYSGLSP